MAYGKAVDKVLAKIDTFTTVYVEEYDGNNEWFLLEGDDLSDDELFYELRRRWAQVVGANYNRFALIYCVQRPDPGVWIHSLSASNGPSQYAPGCFKVSSWS
jgi:hypothetical protein